MNRQSSGGHDETSGQEAFGRYQIRQRLGSGGFAEVFRAFDPELAREVALKVLLPHIAADQGFVERFLQEMRFAAGLTHPNIVPIYDVGRSSLGRPFFTMSLLGGEDLAARLRQRGPMPPEEALRILSPLASALDYLAEQGLVHRDLKPANIFLGPRGEVTLIDFGIARMAAALTHLTQTGNVLGTPQYMAPEQIRGRELSPATDRYTLGLVAYELLSGRPPFSGDTAQVLYAQVNEQPPPLGQVQPSLPRAVISAVTWALAKDPATRPPSATAFVSAFRGQGEPAGPAVVVATGQERAPTPPEDRRAQPPAPAVAAAHAPRRRLPLLLAGLATLLIVGAAAIAIVFAERGSGTPTPHDAPPQTSAAGGQVRSYASAPALAIDPSKQYTATIKTDQGSITVQLFAKDATATVNSFVFLAEHHYYDGLIFDRVVPGFVIQGGDPNGNATGGPGYTLPDEINAHGNDAGAVAMANAGPGTDGSTFYINLASNPGLDGRYTVFGQVTSGMDVVQRIGQTARDPRDTSAPATSTGSGMPGFLPAPITTRTLATTTTQKPTLLVRSAPVPMLLRPELSAASRNRPCRHGAAHRPNGAGRATLESRRRKLPADASPTHRGDDRA